MKSKVSRKDYTYYRNHNNSSLSAKQLLRRRRCYDFFVSLLESYSPNSVGKLSPTASRSHNVLVAFKAIYKALTK